MIRTLVLISAVSLFVSCGTMEPLSTGATMTGYDGKDGVITHSVFADSQSTISEENIRRILDGT